MYDFHYYRTCIFLQGLDFLMNIAMSTLVMPEEKSCNLVEATSESRRRSYRMQLIDDRNVNTKKTEEQLNEPIVIDEDGDESVRYILL